jgi:hypothetical protein
VAGGAAGGVAGSQVRLVIAYGLVSNQWHPRAACDMIWPPRAGWVFGQLGLHWFVGVAYEFGDAR